MNDYIIFKDQNLLDSKKPAAHAIVIGVGEYYYLPNGKSGKITKLHGGLQQLSSPPESARTFTKWLLEQFYNPDKPLATVSLLISEKDGPCEYRHPKLPDPVSPKEAVIENVKRAVRNWKAFGDMNENNLMLFFFCGHGVARGLEGLSLLLADYGASDDMPMEGAVDFAALHRGMAQCKASEQCYFIDACRKVSDIAARTTATGEAIIQDDLNRPFDSPRNFAVFYSTIGGEVAYGQKNKSSYFTEELINGLNGIGSNNRNADNKWRVSTSDLHIAIHRGLASRGDRIQIPSTYLMQFEFHEIQNDPIALAIVYCDPRSSNKLATLYCKQNNIQIDKRKPADEDWKLIVPYGNYDFIAQIETHQGGKHSELIWPPYKEVKIEVLP